MRRCNKRACKRWSFRCWLCFATLNNTPFGFLGEHMFWEKIPYMWWLPRTLGVH